MKILFFVLTFCTASELMAKVTYSQISVIKKPAVKETNGSYFFEDNDSTNRVQNLSSSAGKAFRLRCNSKVTSNNDENSFLDVGATPVNDIIDYRIKISGYDCFSILAAVESASQDYPIEIQLNGKDDVVIRHKLKPALQLEETRAINLLQNH